MFNLQLFADDETVVTGSVTITVQDSSGTALEGATVSYTVDSVVCDATTDANGQVTVEGLEVATYTFTAELDGYTSNTADVTVVADETVDGTIALTAETTTSTLDSALDSAIASATSADSLDDVADAVAEAATTILTTATSTGSVSVVTKLLNEIKTTDSIWVKIRNIGEIGLATVGIAKGSNWVKSKL